MTIFSKKDATGIHPHNNDSMVIIVKCKDWEIKRVLVDQGSSIKYYIGRHLKYFSLTQKIQTLSKDGWLDFLENMYK